MRRLVDLYGDSTGGGAPRQQPHTPMRRTDSQASFKRHGSQTSIASDVSLHSVASTVGFDDSGLPSIFDSLLCEVEDFVSGVGADDSAPAASTPQPMMHSPLRVTPEKEEARRRIAQKSPPKASRDDALVAQALSATPYVGDGRFQQRCLAEALVARAGGRVAQYGLSLGWWMVVVVSAQQVANTYVIR